MFLIKLLQHRRYLTEEGPRLSLTDLANGCSRKSEGVRRLADHGGPSVTRRRLAAELRRLREEQGLTADEVADTLQWSGSKISRIELCRTGVKTADLVKLLNIYGVPAGHRDELLALARERRRKGWWEAYTDVLPSWYAAYIVLESEAEGIFCWSPELVNGLLQTEGYARAVSDTMGAAADPPGEIGRRIQARLRRQRILTGDSPTCVTFVLDESVLLRRLGDSQVMRDQLARLIEVSTAPSISLHVLRLADTHPVGVGGGFALMQFPPVPGIGPTSDVVYVDQFAVGGLYIEDEAQTYRYRLAFQRLVAESLDQARSRDLIESVRRELWS